MSNPDLPRLLVTFPELRALGIPFSRSHVNRLIAAGSFPKPIKLGSSAAKARVHWRYPDLVAWIDERAKASGLPPIGAQANDNTGKLAEAS